MSENLAEAFLNGESLKNAPGPYFGEYGGRWMPESLIAAMDEIMQIQTEGKEKRRVAEGELAQIENELKQKLLEAARS